MYNTNLSRSRGRGFELQVLKRLHGLGFEAKRKVLSGATLATPYDVIVSPYRLKIEAKRTMKEYITLQKKWLDKVTQNLILVFAVGIYRGKKQIEMFALSPFWQNVALEDKCIVMKKNKRIFKAQLYNPQVGRVIVKCDGKVFEIQPFEQYMKKIGKEPEHE